MLALLVPVWAFVKAHWKLCALAAALLAAFCVGRCARPAPVETKTTQTVRDTTHIYTQTDLNIAVTQAVQIERAKHTHETIREVRQKDGTDVKTTEITTDASSQTQSQTATRVQQQTQQSVARQVDTKTVTVTKPVLAPRWTFVLAFGAPIGLKAPYFGTPFFVPTVDYTLGTVGPVSVFVGLWGSFDVHLRNPAAGVETGVTCCQ